MQGLFYYIHPLFALLLILLTGIALFMGIFRAHRDKVSLPGKIGAGILSGVISTTAWAFMYSWTYLSW